jgi:dihydrofolate reductase
LVSQFPRVALIAALAQNRVIGRANQLPWHLPADLAHFKRLTLDKTLIMGRRTWESLPGLLPRRRHIIVTRTPNYQAAGCLVAPSPEAALELAEGVEEVMVIGGETIFRILLPKAQRLYLTLVETRIADGDAFFPHWNPAEWWEVEREERPKDDANSFNLSFVRLERVKV